MLVPPDLIIRAAPFSLCHPSEAQYPRWGRSAMTACHILRFLAVVADARHAVGTQLFLIGS